MIDSGEFQDKTLICKDCSKEFIFTAGEQKFFASKKFHTPVRCKECRLKRSGLQRGHGANIQRGLYEITCAKCGKNDKIPFRPAEGRVLYCKLCYNLIKNRTNSPSQKVATMKP